jgi:hypothetical protein
MGKFAVPAPPMHDLRVDVLDRNRGASLEQLVGSASLCFGSGIAV